MGDTTKRIPFVAGSRSVHFVLLYLSSRPHRLAARTWPSQGQNTGSIPVGAIPLKFSQAGTGDPKGLTSLYLTRFYNGLGRARLCLCAMQIAGTSFLFRFELFNSPLQSFNPGFHVLVDLRGISIIKFIHFVLPHGRLLDEDYQSVTQSRKWTNCLST
jgi:hypothetical protein